MGLLDSLRIRRAIDMLASAPQCSATERTRAQALLKRLKVRATPLVLERLAASGGAGALREVAASLLDSHTLPAFRSALMTGDQRLVETLVEVMTQHDHFDPNLVLDWFQDGSTPKAALISILCAHQESLHEESVARLLDHLRSDNQVAVYRLLENVATPAMVPLLVTRLASNDWRVRLSIARALRRLAGADACAALTQLLSDANKAVRLEALEGVAAQRHPVDIGALAALLRDPDLTVQSKAIEIIIELNDPRSIHYLLDVLQDESEYVRRAAVEVLNKIGNASTIKDLLGALRDKDWWVRVRAADALGTIGGPRVVQATLSLLGDEDEFIRRCAVEILNMAKDGQAFDPLVTALEDDDWWVRERAVDALAALGDRRAVPVLIAFLKLHPEAASITLTALVSLGDPTAVPSLLALLADGNEQLTTQILGVLGDLTDTAHADQVVQALEAIPTAAAEPLRELVNSVLATISPRCATRSEPRPAKPSPRTAGATNSELLSLLANPSSDTSPKVSATERPTTETAVGLPRAVDTGQIIDADALEPGAVLSERYRVIRQVRGGAFGVVVLVEDQVLGEEVILKFLRPHLAADEKVIRRFMQELRCARKISHDNVIRIHDFLALGKSYAISMEYFLSEPLSVEIERVTRIPTERALRILAGTCDGMIAAHHADVVHRDLKPANILINDDDHIKIVDFGVAAAASYSGTRLTATGMVVGTPTYMSPEQIRGQEFDPRADIYSLGVIMYEMLSGRPPYTGDDAISILYQHLEGKVTPPGQLVTGIPAGVEAMVLRAMATDPDQRFQTTEELRDSIAVQLRRGAA